MRVNTAMTACSLVAAVGQIRVQTVTIVGVCYWRLLLIAGVSMSTGGLIACSINY